ncbi:MAG TPA: matrixin family metalloprotease [Pyrinomonadaceae bacterium]|jgi:hypothetical protein
MSDKKEKLYKYLKKRNYLELEEDISAAAKSAKRKAKRFSAIEEKKNLVNAIKRFQTFSGLPATGRANKPTIQEIEEPRCGNSSITLAESVLFDALPPRWHTSNITYGFSRITLQLPQQDVRRAIEFAFRIWRQAFTDFRFTEVPLAQAPMINFTFIAGAHGDHQNFSGQDGILGHSFPPNSPVRRGQVHFDDGEVWGLDGSPSKKDLITVAIHEIGHALGLVEHSLNRDAQMYEKYLRVFRGLDQEDVNRIVNLYR